MKLYLRKYFIKLLHWEYWSMNVVYLPVMVYYVYLSWRAKSFFFFTASNPSIENGGMLGESKWEIFKILPKNSFPNTIFIQKNFDENEINKPLNTQEILEKMQENNIHFPCIAKPDRGERGWFVKKIHNLSALETYQKDIKIDFLIQNFVDYPVELSVFYYRYPNQTNGYVSSVTAKELLYVMGNGKNTLEELVLQKSRAVLQYETLQKEYETEWQNVLPNNEKKLLVPYGNHCRGAMFLDYNHIIDSEFTRFFDELSKNIEGFYYGRYDLRCASIEDLKAGKNFQIVELNGAGAEPSHIYQPNYSFFKAQKTLLFHYKTMCDISMENHKKGVRYWTFGEVYNFLKERKKMRNLIK